MKFKTVYSFFFGFVTFAKTDQVGRYHAVPCFKEGRNHSPVCITPGGIAMKAQPGYIGILWTFIDEMHSQAIQRWEDADVPGRPRVAIELLETCIRRA